MLESTRLERTDTRLHVTCAALAVLAVSCADFEHLRPASRDGGGGLPVTSDVVCQPAEPPAAPVLPALFGPEDFTVATSTFDFGDALDAGSRPYEAFGYDLDNACTSADAGNTCKHPWASANSVDGPGGRDNAVGAVLYDLNSQNANSATDFTNGGNTVGDLVLAIRVWNYNGRSLDDLVHVAIFGVKWHPSGDAGASGPIWDGTDQWDAYTAWLASPEAGATYDLDRPLFEDMAAYVTSVGPSGDAGASNLLVSKFPLLVLGAAPPLHLAQVVMTAEIVKSGGLWSLRNGTFAGRLMIDDSLHALAYIDDPETHSPFCQGQGSYALKKSLTCAVADISYKGPDDLSQTCDAASWAWRFETVPAKVDGTVPVPAPVSLPCAPGKSPTDDRCGP